MRLTIKAEGINDEAIKILVKAVRRLYTPYVEHYTCFERFEVNIGDDNDN